MKYEIEHIYGDCPNTIINADEDFVLFANRVITENEDLDMLVNDTQGGIDYIVEYSSNLNLTVDGKLLSHN